MHPFIEKQLLPIREHGTCTAAFLGDSVTHGVFECLADKSPVFDCDAVYHNVFRRRFADFGSSDAELNHALKQKPVNIINAGINGDSSAGGYARIERDVIAKNHDLCVVNFGLNDVHGDLDRYITHMSLIFDKLSECRIPTIFLTCNMMNTRVIDELIPNPDYRVTAHRTAEMQNSGRLRSYIEAAMEVAASKGVLIADCNAKWEKMSKEGIDTTMLLSNGINHPTRELHGLFADTLFEVMMK